LQQQAQIKRLELLKKEDDAVKLHVMSVKEMEVDAAQTFATGFAQAFTDFASGTKSAGQAFREFAVSFLKSLSQMVIETEVLALVRKIAGISSSTSTAGTGGNLSEYSGGFSAGALSMGGVRFAASGLAGVSSVSRATYFPRFNVIAGE